MLIIILTKLKVINDKLQNYYIEEDILPIEHTKYRIKEDTRIIEKLNRTKKLVTFENIKNHINDIAGVRIVCPFLDDVNEMIELIKKLAKEHYNELKSIRRDLHSHPEVGKEEYRTQKLIISVLNDLGCFKVQKSANTGVIALIEGKKGKNDKCIGVRADIDALGIEDLKEVEEIANVEYLPNFKDSKIIERINNVPA